MKNLEAIAKQNLVMYNGIFDICVNTHIYSYVRIVFFPSIYFHVFFL